MENEVYVQRILTSMRNSLSSAPMYDRGKNMKVGNDGKGNTVGIVEIPFTPKTLSKGLVAETSVNFQYVSGNLSTGHFVFPNGFDKNTVASLDYMLGCGAEAAAKYRVGACFSGMLKLVKFKGARKFYVVGVQIAVQDSQQGAFSSREGKELPDKDISVLFNTTKRLASEIEKAVGRFDKVHIVFPLREGVQIHVSIKKGNSKISADATTYANGPYRSIDDALKGINFEAVYNTFAKLGIPVYTIDYNWGTTGKVKYGEKFQSHFQVQFV